MINSTPPKNKGYRCGYVGIIGRPNVGKSTLMNRTIGQKISITADKPQTTRHRILGIKTTENEQVIYVDTPGVHQDKDSQRAINRMMNRSAMGVIQDVDVVVFVIESLKWTDHDERVLDLIKNSVCPVILVLNKVDAVTDKTTLIPFLQVCAAKYNFAHIIPLSAKTGEMVDQLEAQIPAILPLSPPYFALDQVTDRSEKFLAAEIIREKLTRLLGDELPYELTVEIEYFKYEKQKNIIHINALIWVERDGQKGIVIGKQGQLLKKTGEQARKELEVMLGHKVFLQLWVKVKQGWSDNERVLNSLGYSDKQ